VPGRSGAAERFLRTAPTLSDNGCSVTSASGDPVYASYRPLYDYAWFVGFAVAAGVYVALARRRA